MNPQEQPHGLETPVQYVKGVGPVRAEQLGRLGVATVGDLLYTVPRRYEDRRNFRNIADLRSGEVVVVRGQVAASGWVRPRFGKPFFEARVDDGTGILSCRWFGAAYLQDQLKTGVRVLLYGEVSRQARRPSLSHPELEILDEQDGEVSLHVGRIVPIYALTEDLSQRTLRRIAHQAVETFADAVEEYLPEETLARWRLENARTAVGNLHEPPSLEEARRARFRLAFDEFLCMQLVLVARKMHAERVLEGTAHQSEGRLRRQFLSGLPFALTAAQQRVLQEIRQDMEKPRPMHRLLQGDVGSGKTIVAACALLDAIECGSQGAIMAPTEILARQHARTFAGYFEPLGLRVVCLTGEIDLAQRRTWYEEIARGQVQVVVGTHALIQEKLSYHRLGMAVIDEQHKFGVEQRGLLYRKGNHPDVLVMTATPIPRTLAMTVYGDLDVSLLDELPAGRAEIVTRIIRNDQLPDAYGFIRKQAAKGRQAYVVYPLVSDADGLEVRSAESMFKELSEGAFRGLRLGLLHGQLPSADKDAVMQEFRAGRLDVLVATSVVEVGIDVPNATTMLVENAERFGLSQLHQLRGRVGRGSLKSFCVLQGDHSSEEAWRRLKVMQETTDGFRIAEEDLKIRGMGNLLGPEQSGLPALRIGDPLADVVALQSARQEAFTLLEMDPRLEDPRLEPLRARARALYKISGPFVAVG